MEESGSELDCDTDDDDDYSPNVIKTSSPNTKLDEDTPDINLSPIHETNDMTGDTGKTYTETEILHTRTDNNTIRWST